MSTKRTISSVVRLKEFERDLKRLRKRYRTLEHDLESFIKAGFLAYEKLGQDVTRFERVAGLGFEDPPVYIVKKFACRALKGTHSRSGIRLVFVWFASEGRIELIEIFYKGDKSVPDKNRIKRLYRHRPSSF